MKTFNSQQFAADVRRFRGSCFLEPAAAEIGIEKTMLHRIEHGKLPSITAYGKLCAWMGRQETEYYVQETEDGKL